MPIIISEAWGLWLIKTLKSEGMGFKEIREFFKHQQIIISRIEDV